MEYFLPVLHTSAALVVVVTLIRLVGLRSLSKMSGFDFVTTVASGSVLAAAVTASGDSAGVALIGLAALFGLQWGLAAVRMAVPGLRRTLDNAPLMLMENGRILDSNLARAQVAKSDIYAKLREANALDLAQVHAVVMESTGDISVLHGPPGAEVSPELLEGVAR